MIKDHDQSRRIQQHDKLSNLWDNSIPNNEERNIIAPPEIYRNVGDLKIVLEASSITSWKHFFMVLGILKAVNRFVNLETHWMMS